MWLFDCFTVRNGEIRPQRKSWQIGGIVRIKGLGGGWGVGMERERGSRSAVGMEVFRDSLRTNMGTRRDHPSLNPSAWNRRGALTLLRDARIKGGLRKHSLTRGHPTKSMGPVQSGGAPHLPTESHHQSVISQILVSVLVILVGGGQPCCSYSEGMLSRLNYVQPTELLILPAIVAFWSKMFGSVLHIANEVHLLSLIVRQIDVDVYTLLFTEGTTARPKPCPRFHEHSWSITSGVLGHRGHCCAVLLWVWPIAHHKWGGLSTTTS